MSETLKLDTQEDREALAQQAIEDAQVLEELVELLTGPSRIRRQKAATVIAIASDIDASALLPQVEGISEGLAKPEAQTRWEILHALDQMGKAGQRYGDDVIAAAEDALYDEGSGIVREAAFRFFCGYGGASESNSNEVWSLIDEAIQCFHGNPEFPDMLTQLVDFAQANISMETSEALALRMRFDSENASGTLRMRAEQILEAYKARGGDLGDKQVARIEPSASDDFDD